MLLAAIRRRVTPKAMLLIKSHYTELMVYKVAATDAYVLYDKVSLMLYFVLVQGNKISHDDFVMKLRLIVGDNILKSVVTNLRDKVPNF